jgi:GT2 family glycosyltransferase/glycosyltransferase involved in cell wall biosynthesis
MSDRPAGRPPPRTRAEVESELAQSALRQGDALLAAGDPAGALRWLERAGRIALNDDTVTLSRALALLALGDPGATTLLESLSRRHDVREVWLGLADCRRREGSLSAAAAALAHALSGHLLADLPAIEATADAIAARAGAAGWCGLLDDGTVLVRPTSGGDVVVLADGAACRAGRAPPGARSITVTRGGRHLLGSPIDGARIRRVEGFVTARDGGIEGWAWHPGDAGRDPVLTVVPPRGGARLRVVASDTAMAAPRPLSRPRRFTLSAAALAHCDGPVAIRGADGRDLTGSPLDPGVEIRAAAAAAMAVARALPALGRGTRGPVPWLPTPARLAGPPATAPRRPRRRVAVVVPVYRGLAVTMACLDAALGTVPRGTVVIVVDDASPEPALVAAVDALARRGRVRLVRHRHNRGFPAAANAGLRAAAALPGEPDVVLLNSDTVPTLGWLDTLRAVVHGAGDIGTAAPLSNDAAILSYPDPANPAAPPSGRDLRDLAALAARTHGATAVQIPTSVGFCMYIRRECLLATGLLREDVFAQGYGEENDFCIRAGHLGWRHVAAPGAYVAHVGGHSFGDARSHLIARNLDVLDALHPGYRAAIAVWLAGDTLAPARRCLDAARWAARRPPRAVRGAVVLVTHDGGGGVERAVRARCAELRAEGLRPILLRPVLDRSGSPAALRRRYLPGLCVLGDGAAGGFPNLRFRLPQELAELATLLRDERPRLLEVHHLLGLPHCVVELAARLRIPYEIRVHDYAWICPRINLVGPGHRYCGEPDVTACAACVADAGSELEEDIAPVALRARSAADMAGARRVVAPSRDTEIRLRRYFPGVHTDVEPHEDDGDLPPLRPWPPSPRPLRVGVIGAIGTAKGYDVVLACARDAAARDLSLSFIVVGHTEDDERLLATGRVFITGPYLESDAEVLIRQQELHLAWLPSVWPETWCYALGLALRAGLGAAAFDIGAQAERIRATGRGWLLPLGLSIPAINNALLALRTMASDEYPRLPPLAESSTNTQRSITARI